MAPTASREGSSTSAPRPSPGSPRSPRAWPGSGSPGRGRPAASPGLPTKLTPSALRALAARHGIRPRKSLGQHFLIEPALARRIAELAEVGPGSRVVEIGAGLGSLTVALAQTGALVLAMEVDERLKPALEETAGSLPNTRIVMADALTIDWEDLLEGDPWTLVANLPYNVAVPVVMRILDLEPRVRRLLVMVQREVGERLCARPGDEAYGGLSLRVEYRAEARLARRVPPAVFWPRPRVASVLVEMRRRPPPVQADREALWNVVEISFRERRKTMRQAVLRMGIPATDAARLLERCGIEQRRRPEELGLGDFACLARAIGAEHRRAAG